MFKQINFLSLSVLFHSAWKRSNLLPANNEITSNAYQQYRGRIIKKRGLQKGLITLQYKNYYYRF